MNKGATISGCGKYRYWLGRRWDAGNPAVALFVMLNPSTADADADDPTIRRCVGYARAWGLGGIDVVNLFAYRATDPAELLKLTPDVALGPDNPTAIGQQLVGRTGPVVLAWGVHKMASGPGNTLARAVRLAGLEPRCLGKNRDGSPKHPLYLRNDAELIPFLEPQVETSPKS